MLAVMAYRPSPMYSVITRTDDTPGVVLISLRTLPAEVFYSPPAVKAATNSAVKAVEDISKLLTRKEETEPAAPPPVAFQKTLYKHAVEVSVKGSYAELVSYMEKLQKYPKRVFWSDARLTVSVNPATVLRLTIFVITDSPLAALS